MLFDVSEYLYESFTYAIRAAADSLFCPALSMARIDVQDIRKSARGWKTDRPID